MKFIPNLLKRNISQKSQCLYYCWFVKLECINMNKKVVLFNNTDCLFCERFKTKDQWNKHVYSNRPLHREVNG